MVVQQKTGRPVQFEIIGTEPESLTRWAEVRGGAADATQAASTPDGSMTGSRR